jgi:hypothetical protein
MHVNLSTTLRTLVIASILDYGIGILEDYSPRMAELIL